MAIFTTAQVTLDPSGQVRWSVNSHPTGEALGLIPYSSYLRVGEPVRDEDPYAIAHYAGLAHAALAARLLRIADNAAWSIPLFGSRVGRDGTDI
jgi:hypothetical protein